MCAPWKKINRCANNLCVGASIRKNSSGGGGGAGINFYSSYMLTFFCTHVKGNIQDNHTIFPDDDNGLVNNKLE